MILSPNWTRGTFLNPGVCNKSVEIYSVWVWCRKGRGVPKFIISFSLKAEQPVNVSLKEVRDDLQWFNRHFAFL